MELSVKNFSITSLIRRFCLSWLFAVTLEWLILPIEYRDLTNLQGLGQMSLPRVFLFTCVSILVFTLLDYKWETVKLERWSIVGVFAVLFTAVSLNNPSALFIIVCLLLLIHLIVYAKYGWNNTINEITEMKKDNRVHFILVILLSIFVAVFLSIWTVCRVLRFITPTYDFGLFSQMFYYMKETGLPMTTLERDGLLSHFAVHVSPIYYLMLPFYMLVPTPATLQVLQALIIVSAVIPVWKLGKIHGLSSGSRLLVCIIFLFLPAYLGGVTYDMHENCFLTPLILWLFYGIDRKNTIITAVSAVLLLMVKEDAAVYLAVIALWMIASVLVKYKKENKKELITGVALLVASIVWFVAVTFYLAKYGDGVMTNRYDNFNYDESGSLITVIKAVLMSPMKAIFECTDMEKYKYILITMLPVLFIPFITRRYERLILIIPYLLVNLMSDYEFQHDIYFQYSFGSVACMFYLYIVNYADIKHKRKTAILITSIVLTMMLFIANVVPKSTISPNLYLNNTEEYEEMRDIFSEIPEEADVSANTFFTTELSQRKVIYDIYRTTKEHILETEYVVMDKTATRDFNKFATEGKENGFDCFIKLLTDNDYEKILEKEKILIYKKKS